jgi:hypothetical protein
MTEQIISKIFREKEEAKKEYQENINTIVEQLYDQVLMSFSCSEDTYGLNMKLVGKIEFLCPNLLGFETNQNEMVKVCTYFEEIYKNTEKTSSQIMLSTPSTINYHTTIIVVPNEDLINVFKNEKYIGFPLINFYNLESIFTQFPKLNSSKNNPLSTWNDIGESKFASIRQSTRKPKQVLLHDNLMSHISNGLYLHFKDDVQKKNKAFKFIEKKMMALKLSENLLEHNQNKNKDTAKLKI